MAIIDQQKDNSSATFSLSWHLWLLSLLLKLHTSFKAEEFVSLSIGLPQNFTMDSDHSKKFLLYLLEEFQKRLFIFYFFPNSDILKVDTYPLVKDKTNQIREGETGRTDMSQCLSWTIAFCQAWAVRKDALGKNIMIIIIPGWSKAGCRRAGGEGNYDRCSILSLLGFPLGKICAQSGAFCLYDS